MSSLGDSNSLVVDPAGLPLPTLGALAGNVPDNLSKYSLKLSISCLLVRVTSTLMGPLCCTFGPEFISV